MRISDWSSDVCSSDLNGSYSFRAFRLRAFSPEMTQHDDFDPLIAPARGRAGSEAVRTYETIKRHALTEMAGVLSGFWGSIEEQVRSEEHTSELQSLMRISYAVFCLNKKKKNSR